MNSQTMRYRMADLVGSPAIIAKGLENSYRDEPAVGAIEGPAALFFGGIWTPSPSAEQVWETEMRCHLMTLATGRRFAEINALEELIVPITDLFAPGTDGYQLRVPGEPGMVHHCFPLKWEVIDEMLYDEVAYTVVVGYFSVKFHRDVGEE